MIFNSISDWLLEQEYKKKPAVFLLEWLFVFSFSVVFWTILFYEFETSIRSTVAATAVSVLYACSFVYVRLFPLTKCKKCNSLLPLAREEIGRRHIHDKEKCLEIEHGGEEYWGHFIDLYHRIYRVDIVKFRCRRCRAMWEEVEQVPASDFRLVRIIKVKD